MSCAVVKRVTDLDEGFQWSMADVYNGASVGYEVGSRFAGASSNVAQVSSIEPGLNELRISLGLLDASNKGLVVLVRKDSAVVVSSWRPALLRPLVKSSIDGDRVSITVKGENQGWATSKLDATARVTYADGAHQTHSWSADSVGPLAEFRTEETFLLDANPESTGAMVTVVDTRDDG